MTTPNPYICEKEQAFQEYLQSRINRLIPGHSRNCSYGGSDDDMGDFCTCKLKERKQELREILTTAFLRGEK